MAGPVLADKLLSSSVRRKALKEIERVLDGEDCKYKKQIVLKLAGTVLPRLNEHTGEDGGAIVTVVKFANGDKPTVPVSAEGLPTPVVASL